MFTAVDRCILPFPSDNRHTRLLTAVDSVYYRSQLIGILYCLLLLIGVYYRFLQIIGIHVCLLLLTAYRSQLIGILYCLLLLIVVYHSFLHLISIHNCLTLLIGAYTIISCGRRHSSSSPFICFFLGGWGCGGGGGGRAGSVGVSEGCGYVSRTILSRLLSSVTRPSCRGESQHCFFFPFLSVLRLPPHPQPLQLHPLSPPTPPHSPPPPPPPPPPQERLQCVLCR